MNANKQNQQSKNIQPNDIKIALVENNITHITESLTRIENKIDKLDSKVERIENRLWTIAFTLLVTIGGCFITNFFQLGK